MRFSEKCIIMAGVLFACTISWLTSVGITSLMEGDTVLGDQTEYVTHLEDSLEVCMTSLERVRGQLFNEADSLSNLERMRIMEYEMADTVYPMRETPESDR